MTETMLPARTSLDADLVRLTAKLDEEVQSFASHKAGAPARDGAVVFAAAPGAIVTAAVGICAGAIWLASALPY